MRLPPNEIHLWLVSDREIKDQALLKQYHALLSKEEQSQLPRFLSPLHRHQYLVTRALVRTVLSEYDNTTTPENLQFVRNEYGKPKVVNFDETTRLSFNLSHSDGLVVLAVAAGQMLGVDVEYLLRATDVMRLAERYFAPQEVRDLKNIEESCVNERFFDFWTLKEAYIKAKGLGLSIPLDEFSFQFRGKEISVTFSTNLDEHASRWFFWQFKPTADHKLALAMAGESLADVMLRFYRGVPLQGFQRVSYEVDRSSMPVRPSVLNPGLFLQH